MKMLEVKYLSWKALKCIMKSDENAGSQIFKLESIPMHLELHFIPFERK
jgi:hypothetical protein